LRIVNLYKFLVGKKEFVLSKQVLRSGTSIGANIKEAIGGQSEKDFLSKFAIAYKEDRETKYWIKPLIDRSFLEFKQTEFLLNDCDELCRIIAKIQITCKEKYNS